jgi:hypothetical protein
VWGSVVGDFTNFADMFFGEVTDDSAFSVRCQSGQVNNIVYFSPSQTLMVGTTGGEFIIGPQSISDPFGPSNLGVSLQSEYGGRAVSPVRVQQYTLFVTKNGRVVRESSFAFAAGPAGANVSADVTVLSEHITEGGIVAMAWAKNPFTTVFIVLGNGNVVSFTYNPEQSVKSWARHALGAGGQAVSVTVVPNGSGDWDDVYLVVRRTTTFNGLVTTFYTIERIEQPYANLAGDSLQDAFYVDCGSLRSTTPIDAQLLLGNGDYTVPGTTKYFVPRQRECVRRQRCRAVHPLRLDHDRYRRRRFADAASHARCGADHAIRQRARRTGYGARSVPEFLWCAHPANGWRMTVTQITNPLVAWQGQTVSILADGACEPDQVVGFLGDPLQLSRPCSVAQIGIKSPAVWRSMKPEGGDPTGSNMGKLKRDIRLTIRYVNTLGFSYGPSYDQFIEWDAYPPDMVDDDPRMATTGESVRLSFDGNWDRFGRVMIAQTRPLPLTIAAIAMTMGEEPDG